jgi:hypothetical protein
MVEGTAERVTSRAELERLAAAWRTKWDGSWKFEVGDDGSFRNEGGGDGEALVFAVRPAKVLAFAKGTFSHTRHVFAAGPPD